MCNNLVAGASWLQRGVEIRIVREDGRNAGAEENGEIWAREPACPSEIFIKSELPIGPTGKFSRSGSSSLRRARTPLRNGFVAPPWGGSLIVVSGIRTVRPIGGGGKTLMIAEYIKVQILGAPMGLQ
jgi:hypothetical protein